ncbi:hypothetical protein [Desulfococcus sp.]|uniref:hypothetical protein n=1 Tax=Desulfococcus sp. TaxID=2025834 RepID=UPI00359314D7
MKRAECKQRVEPISLIPNNIPEEITEEDRKFFSEVVSVDLDDAQRARILNPEMTFPNQKAVLAVHWHPEHVPLSLINRRIDAMFPGREQELIIPTQHNELMSYGDYTGVEVDCYSAGFNQKVQLLLHFENSRLSEAGVLRGMLDHTFKYRSSQLFDFIHSITKPDEERLSMAARQTGASDAVICFVQAYVRKIEALLEEQISHISPLSIKNKLLRNFFDRLRSTCGDGVIDRCQTFLTEVKRLVKLSFPSHYFFRTSEIIEEARHLNAGIVIPHPEQFWPVLLAGYDVDGVEVWNPQSHRYTDFLVSVLNEKNRLAGPTRRPLLVFMGDDTHMGEKTRNIIDQDPAKRSREIGYQPAWEDLNIGKTLIKAGWSRESVITEYKARLSG